MLNAKEIPQGSLPKPLTFSPHISHSTPASGVDPARESYFLNLINDLVRFDTTVRENAAIALGNHVIIATDDEKDHIFERLLFRLNKFEADPKVAYAIMISLENFRGVQYVNFMPSHGNAMLAIDVELLTKEQRDVLAFMLLDNITDIECRSFKTMLLSLCHLTPPEKSHMKIAMMLSRIAPGMLSNDEEIRELIAVAMKTLRPHLSTCLNMTVEISLENVNGAHLLIDRYLKTLEAREKGANDTLSEETRKAICTPSPENVRFFAKQAKENLRQFTPDEVTGLIRFLADKDAQVREAAAIGLTSWLDAYVCKTNADKTALEIVKNNIWDSLMTMLALEQQADVVDAITTAMSRFIGVTPQMILVPFPAANRTSPHIDRLSQHQRDSLLTTWLLSSLVHGSMLQREAALESLRIIIAYVSESKKTEAVAYILKEFGNDNIAPGCRTSMAHFIGDLFSHGSVFHRMTIFNRLMEMQPDLEVKAALQSCSPHASQDQIYRLNALERTMKKPRLG